MKIELSLSSKEKNEIIVQSNVDFFSNLVGKRTKHGDLIVNSISELRSKIEDAGYQTIDTDINVYIDKKIFAHKSKGSMDYTFTFSEQLSKDLTEKFYTEDVLKFDIYKGTDGYIVRLTNKENAYLENTSGDSSLIKNISKDTSFKTFEEALKAIDFYQVDMSSDIKLYDGYEIKVNGENYQNKEFGLTYEFDNLEEIRIKCKKVDKKAEVIHISEAKLLKVKHQNSSDKPSL